MTELIQGYGSPIKLGHDISISLPTHRPYRPTSRFDATPYRMDRDEAERLGIESVEAGNVTILLRVMTSETQLHPDDLRNLGTTLIDIANSQRKKWPWPPVEVKP